VPRTSAPEAPRIGWLGTARRLQRVGLVLAKHGFGEIVARIGVMVPRSTAAAPAQPSRERVAQRVADVLTELGPTYIKLGQLLATRADLFSPEVVRALSSLHASVRPIPLADVVRILEQELGRSPYRLFRSFEERELAAASIGQVHRAVLHDGTPVAVKVQRPGIRKQIEADLAIIRSIAQRLAQHVPEVAEYEPVALVDAFARSIMQELDFRTEADNARKLRLALADASEVHVPHFYEQFTTERVLVMEYVVGSRIHDLPHPQRSRARAALLRAFVRQIVDRGVFHADPHPGNLLVQSDGRIVLLDLGTIDVLEDALRTRLFHLGLALVLRRPARLAACVVELAQTRGQHQLDEERLQRDIDALLRAASGDGSAVLGQMLALSRTHGLSLPAALLALMRATAILDGVLRGLEPTRNLVRDVRRELAWAAWRRVRRGVTELAHKLSSLLRAGGRRS
jgi:ubiquinone biosynthesis protein